MTAERSAKDILAQYKQATSALEGYEHHQDLDHEFQALHSLEKELFEQKRIFEDPSLLLNLSVSVSEGGEMVEGSVTGVEINPTGGVMAVVLKGHPKPILITENTTIKPAKNN